MFHDHRAHRGSTSRFNQNSNVPTTTGLCPRYSACHRWRLLTIARSRSACPQRIMSAGKEDSRNGVCDGFEMLLCPLGHRKSWRDGATLDHRVRDSRAGAPARVCRRFTRARAPGQRPKARTRREQEPTHKDRISGKTEISKMGIVGCPQDLVFTVSQQPARTVERLAVPDPVQ